MSVVVSAAPKIFGPFEVLAKIGRGASADVYQVRHRASGTMAALKVGPRFLQLAPDVVKRFKREFIAIRPLRHPNLVRALGFGEHNGFQYLATEFVPGGNLEDRLKTQPLTPDETVAIFSQIADGVCYLHSHQIIHRDIKPSNIFLTPTNLAKLGDFGLIKDLTDDATLTQTRQSMGTIEYGAPEQFEDAKRVDQRCDLYSLAATLYTAFTGKFPFGNGGHMQILQRKLLNQFVPLRLLVPRIDSAVDRFVSRCLSADPAQRPTRCEELRDILRDYRPAYVIKGYKENDAAYVSRIDRRACVRFAVDLTATLVPFHQNLRGRWDATIVDASPRGVRLRASRTAAVNSVLQVTLGHRCRTELAVVRWVQPSQDETQILGCVFIRPLSGEEFDELFPPASRNAST